MSFLEKTRNFLSEHPIIKHLSYVALLTILLLIGMVIFMKFFTRQGNVVIVPDFTGLSKTEVKEFAEKHDLDCEIIDSVFSMDKKKGTVILQTPVSQTKVKAGRKIYLTIVTGEQEKISMPNFKDLSLRLAQSVIESYGLKLKKFTYVPSQFKDVVLDQYYDGKSIMPGTKILRGSEIELKVGDGMQQGKVNVPFLYGMTLSEATSELVLNSLNVGNKVYEKCDSTNGRVYKQIPECMPEVKLKAGETVDLYFKPATFDFKSLIKQKAQDTVR